MTYKGSCFLHGSVHALLYSLYLALPAESLGSAPAILSDIAPASLGCVTGTLVSSSPLKWCFELSPWELLPFQHLTTDAMLYLSKLPLALQKIWKRALKKWKAVFLLSLLDVKSEKLVYFIQLDYFMYKRKKKGNYILWNRSPVTQQFTT